MSRAEDLLRGLDGGWSSTRSAGSPDEHTWNILVQVLLPLVFVLTFVIITGIIAYKTAYEGLREFLDKDAVYAEVQAQERLVELQLEKLLRALEEVKRARREELRLPLFPTPGHIRRAEVEIADEDFRRLCDRSLELLDEGAQARRLGFAREIYRDVLETAGVKDPTGYRVRRWSEVGDEMLERSAILKAQKGVVVYPNRRKIHNLILDFVNGLEEQVVTLQVGLVQQLFEQLLEQGVSEELDPGAAQALRALLDPATTELEQKRAADQLYRSFLRRWRRRLNEGGYPFLEESWRFLRG